MKIIVFNHLYKNAGSTVWERYKNNECSTLLRHPTWNMPKKCIRIKNGEPYTTLFKIKNLDPPPYYIHGRCHPGLLESYTPGDFKCDPIYTTTLREPIDRIMSAYNFYITDVYHKWGDNIEIDFKLWFLNAYNILPTSYESQLQWFTQHVYPDPELPWQRDIQRLYDRFRTRSFGNKVLPGEKRISEEEAKAVEQANLKLAFTNIKRDYKHVFFLEDEQFLTKLDKVFVENDIPVIPNKDISFTHKTSDAYRPLDREYITFKDLSKEYQDLAYYMLEHEIKFYNKCKNRWL